MTDSIKTHEQAVKVLADWREEQIAAGLTPAEIVRRIQAVTRQLGPIGVRKAND